MSTAKKIPGTESAWDDRMLGSSEEHAALAPKDLQEQVEDALAMQMISIRLPKQVIKLFKALAQIEGIGYQPLMREALTRFAEGEARHVVMEMAREDKRQRKEREAKKAAPNSESKDCVRTSGPGRGGIWSPDPHSVP